VALAATNREHFEEEEDLGRLVREYQNVSDTLQEVEKVLTEKQFAER